jgi:exopolysaccharide biosynthesis polyprenyl glycosylphosphotransferase
MRKRHARLKQLFAFALTDVGGLLGGLLVAYSLRFHAGIIDVTKGYTVESYLRIIPLAIVVWLFWLNQIGCYEFRERAFNLQILKKIFQANLLAVMTIITLHFFERSFEYSRIVYVLSLVSCTTSIGIARFALDRVLAHLRHAGILPNASVLVLGTNPLAVNIAERIRNHAYLGMRVAGFVSASADGQPAEIDGFPVLGDFSRIREIIREQEIAEVIVAQPNLSPPEILDFILECEKEIVSIRVIPNLLEAFLVEMSVEQIDGIPLFGLKESPLQGWNILLKRAFDMLISALVLALASPFMAAIAAFVKLGSPGPVLYRQTRVGLDGTRFDIFKFRSMHVGAEETTGPVWATENDARVTAIGRILRGFNLDELPQFWNVLRGDMSLVGPRPERPHFVHQFREVIPRYMGRHRVKSGMTGWAQVNGLRGNTSIDERIKFDLYYIENWSIWLDLKILLMTLRARQNAY